MTETEKMNKKHLEDVERIKNFRLLDDDFMTQCFSGDTAGIELVLRIILEKPDLKVVDVSTQVFVGNLLNRSVRLDVVATDNLNAKYESSGRQRELAVKEPAITAVCWTQNFYRKAMILTNCQKVM